jgi:hypothetical protein
MARRGGRSRARIGRRFHRRIGGGGGIAAVHDSAKRIFFIDGASVQARDHYSNQDNATVIIAPGSLCVQFRTIFAMLGIMMIFCLPPIIVFSTVFAGQDIDVPIVIFLPVLFPFLIFVSCMIPICINLKRSVVLSFSRQARSSERSLMRVDVRHLWGCSKTHEYEVSKVRIAEFMGSKYVTIQVHESTYSAVPYRLFSVSTHVDMSQVARIDTSRMVETSEAAEVFKLLHDIVPDSSLDIENHLVNSLNAVVSSVPLGNLQQAVVQTNSIQGMNPSSSNPFQTNATSSQPPTYDNNATSSSPYPSKAWEPQPPSYDR